MKLTSCHRQNIQKRNHIPTPHHQEAAWTRPLHPTLVLLGHRIPQRLLFLTPEPLATREGIGRRDAAEGTCVGRVVQVRLLHVDSCLYVAVAGFGCLSFASMKCLSYD